MNRRDLGALALLAGLAACAPESAPPGQGYWSATLPPDSVQGAGDPTMAALTRAAYAFSTPAALAGNPAEAARAIADIEYLAVELTGPRWTSLPLAANALGTARAEWRAALGIGPTVPPQAVIDSLWTVRRALMSGRPDVAAAALPPTIYAPPGPPALGRLAQLPPLPRTAAAAVLANREARESLMSRDPRPIR